MKKDALFLILVSCLTAGLVYFFGKFKDHYSDELFLSLEISKHERMLEKKDLELQVAHQRFFDFEQSVIAQLPKEGKQYVALRSNFRAPAAVETLEFAEALLAKGQEHFNDKEYPEAIQVFRQFEKKHPTSLLLPKAIFLRAEAEFLSGEFENFLGTTDFMMSHYPENELSGFLMVRMAQVYEFRKRVPEAKQIYSSVMDKFKNPQLKEQARRSLEVLENKL